MLAASLSRLVRSACSDRHAGGATIIGHVLDLPPGSAHRPCCRRAVNDATKAKFEQAAATRAAPNGLSIITAADPQRLDHFDAAAASVARLHDHAELPVERIVCLDDPAASVSGPDIVLALPAQRGQSTARNWALAYAQGDLVHPLDADDEIVVNGLIKACETLCADDDLGWVAGDRVIQRGERLWFPLTEDHHFAAGAQHVFLQEWVAPFHYNSIVARRRLVLAAGGWPAVPTGEDFAMVVALNRLSAGKFIADVVGVYRVWERQVTKTKEFKHEKAMARKMVAAFDEAAPSG